MADDAGEKMLTPGRLANIRVAVRAWKGGASINGEVLFDQLLDHIVEANELIERQSATIKRLETPVADGDYLIWSNEHRAWWRPNSAGYTVRLAAAGRYDRDAAIFICRGARHGWKDGDVPTEIPVREFDAKHAALSLNSVETREMKP